MKPKNGSSGGTLLQNWGLKARLLASIFGLVIALPSALMTLHLRLVQSLKSQVPRYSPNLVSHLISGLLLVSLITLPFTVWLAWERWHRKAENGVLRDRKGNAFCPTCRKLMRHRTLSNGEIFPYCPVCEGSDW